MMSNEEIVDCQFSRRQLSRQRGLSIGHRKSGIDYFLQACQLTMLKSYNFTS